MASMAVGRRNYRAAAILIGHCVACLIVVRQLAEVVASEEATGAAGDLLQPHLSQVDARLSELLGRDGPDIRSNRANHDFKDVDLETAERAWRLMAQHLETEFRARLGSHEPLINELLHKSNASLACHQAVAETLAGAHRMEAWAVRLVNSWGRLPAAGLFEGTYTHPGSYHTCTSIPRNPFIQHAHYCTLTFRPVLPSHRDYEIVLRQEPERLLNLFKRAANSSAQAPLPNTTQDAWAPEAREHALTELLEHAQYFHYVYLKLGTCWPIGCSPFDVKRVARQLGWRHALLNGPVKCFSHHPNDYEQPGTWLSSSELANSTNQRHRKLLISTADLNGGLFVWKPYYTRAQQLAYYLLAAVGGCLLACTLFDLLCFRLPEWWRRRQNTCDAAAAAPIEGMDLKPIPPVACRDPTVIACQQQQQQVPQVERSSSRYARFARDMSVVTNWLEFFALNQSQLKNDILCLNGLRCVTMVWIIVTHTLLYNDWSAFGRIREIERAIRSIATQPLFNASYLVDTFFLMSGLLTSYSVFKSGSLKRFKWHSFLVSRWLRLTPQILLVSLIYVVLPHLNRGPNWYQQVGEYSENCSQNWWVNLLHLQAFFRSDFMCNFPTWWVSIDSYYHLFALAVVCVHSRLGSRWSVGLVGALMVAHASVQAQQHYSLKLPPNILSTIPQTGAMWATMTLGFYWRPYSHSLPFFVGFLAGLLLTPKRRFLEAHLTPARAASLSLLASVSILAQSYSTWWWVSGQAGYSRLGATLFHLSAQLVWALCMAWLIVACHKGYLKPLNKFLSANSFLILGKASYMIYLTHFQVIFTAYGSQNLLMEPAPLQMAYLIAGNIVFSLLYGCLMCIHLEMPLLKIQKRLMSYLL